MLRSASQKVVFSETGINAVVIAMNIVMIVGRLVILLGDDEVISGGMVGCSLMDVPLLRSRLLGRVGGGPGTGTQVDIIPGTYLSR